MKGTLFKKASLLGGILLLSVFVLIQLSWGCDDDDRWDRGCHDKWHCDHYSRPCHPPNIQIVYLDHLAGSIEFNIWGKNFAKGAPPVVTLGGLYKLDVEDDYSDTHIIATLPLQNLNGKFEYGDYRLVVSTCHDSACRCKYCKGLYSKCKDKYSKDKYCNDRECKCRCKDRYSLTIADPAGQNGPSANLVTVIVKATESEFTYDHSTGISFGTAACKTAGKGYRVTGGGFSAGKDGTVIESKPVADGTGWELVVTGGPPDFSQPPPGVTVWAVCAQVQ